MSKFFVFSSSLRIVVTLIKSSILDKIVLNNGKPEEIISAKLIFSDTVNPEGDETITKEQQAEFHF